MSIGISAALGAEVERLRAELAEARKPDCRTCQHFDEIAQLCFPRPCQNGEAYVLHEPVRLYEKEESK